MDVIHIAEASDANYFIGLLISVESIARNARKDVALVFHILDGGIEDSSYDLLVMTLAAAHPHTSVVRHRIDGKNAFSGLRNWKGSKMAYARLMLPELLPNEDFILYADCDTLWLTDVAEMWEFRPAEVPVAAVSDPYGAKTETDWFRARGIPFYPETYFNSGNILLNLKICRNEGLSRQMTDFLAQHPDSLYADQGALNAVLGKRVYLLPQRFNTLVRDFRREVPTTAAVWHYAALTPWRATSWIDLLHPAIAAWYETRAHINGLEESLLYRTYCQRKSQLFARLLPHLLAQRMIRWPLLVFVELLGRTDLTNRIRLLANFYR